MIKTHRELAEHIAGKRILHMNSLGKDSVISLEWLTSFAAPSHITSVFFRFEAAHPGDAPYMRYLMRRFRNVEFISRPNTVEITLCALGVYQDPIAQMEVHNHFEYDEFERGKQVAELMNEYHCDFACRGDSKYEDFSRRVKFHQKGLVFKNEIFPLGMMSKDQVIGLIKTTGIKLHPCYRTSPGTYDHPSYWKMRSGWLYDPKYRANVLKMFPLMVLDEYRYERMLGRG